MWGKLRIFKVRNKEILSSEITDFSTSPRFSPKYINIKKKYFYLCYRRENSQLLLKSLISELKL